MFYRSCCRLELFYGCVIWCIFQDDTVILRSSEIFGDVT